MYQQLKISFVLFFLTTICGIAIFGQTRGDVRIMFYNVENYFDTKDDPHKNDNEFTPEGDKHWNDYRYRQKTNKIYKVIANTGGWEPPEIVGLCEIENKEVLLNLVNNTPLAKFPYEIIHYESPDKRGIDVALLYQRKVFTEIRSEVLNVGQKFEHPFFSRDILYAELTTTKGDTLHVFVNHWPSRSGGQIRSEPRRIYAASILREKVDSLFLTGIEKRIIIMGDFNDGPENKSVEDILKAKKDFRDIKNRELYNLSKGTKEIGGTYRYQGKWDLLDNFIVSGFLLNSKDGLSTNQDSYSIVQFPFLLEEEKSQLGVKPFRTYRGPMYIGGYSDHLPVTLDLWQK